MQNKKKLWKEKRVIKTYSDEYYNEEVRAALNNWKIRKVRKEQNRFIDNKQKINYIPLAVILAIITLGIGAYFFFEPGITGAVIGDENIILQDNISTEETIQGYAEINKPVKWNKKIIFKESRENVTVSLPQNITNIKVYKIINETKEEISQDKLKIAEENRPENEEITTIFATGDIQEETNLSIEDKVEEVEIEYDTEGPPIVENEIDENRKEIMVYSEVHYTEILAYTTIREASKDLIKLYRTTDGIREPAEIINYADTNNNSLIDKIEWIVPSLSNETYELIIEISKAEHLNESREFISDIYEQVNDLDNIWSEPINNNEYVRVTFERNLTSDRDITLWPKVVSGTPKIEVYEKDGTEKIAEFTTINSNEYNKVLLTNLQSESQDIFDLKIVSGSVEIDPPEPPPFAVNLNRAAFSLQISGQGLVVR